MPIETDLDDCRRKDSVSSCKETFISMKEASIWLQSCEVLTSRRRSVNGVAFNSLVKERYRKVVGTKYRLGKLFASMVYLQNEEMLKVTISQYGNVQFNTQSGKREDLSRKQLSLHVSLRQNNSMLSKQKIDVIQNEALRVFKYNYVSRFPDINENTLQSSFLRIKLKCKRSVFRGAYTVVQRDINLKEVNTGAETPLDILFI